ncbi:MAG: hypothetical protein CVU38_00105 [Chloroflexi bacterium HGW-Chloroflexi-1]|nr:MAG: hypothetical protein CVU38_00105 [Chloroflexi bacterium HGW-Chloroflexi-1]
MSKPQVHLTLKRAAQELSVHEQTLRSWEKRGLIRMIRLPGSRYRRVPVEEVERLKREMTSPAAPTGVEMQPAAWDAESAELARGRAAAVEAGLAALEAPSQGEYAPKARVITVQEPPTVYGVPFDETVLAHGPVVLELEGRLVAALIAPEEYQAFQSWRRSQSWREEQLAHLQSERAAFQRLLPELLDTHAGQFVAIHDGRVVDADADQRALAGRVITQGWEPVYIQEVRAEPYVYEVPSPEVVRHVPLRRE